MADHNTSLGNIPISREQLQDTHPDTLDFRDLMYVPTLVEVPVRRTVDEYLSCFEGYAPTNKGPVLNQGKEGACTGFGLATVANYLLWRRQIVPDSDRVSPRMLYEMARRYDEWPGENYAGSSARGAMKGWHKHGVCAETTWPYKVSGQDGVMSRIANALLLPAPSVSVRPVTHCSASLQSDKVSAWKR